MMPVALPWPRLAFQPGASWTWVCATGRWPTGPSSQRGSSQVCSLRPF